jgi:hypothetical protein
MAMDSLLKEADWNEQERKRQAWAREKEQTDAVVRMLDEKYGRMETRKIEEKYPAGTVVIIGQNVFRNGHYTRHFYRTILGYHDSCVHLNVPHFIEAPDEEWPDIPPWASVVNHENEARDIGLNGEHLHWAIGKTEPMLTWWQKEWEA